MKTIQVKNLIRRIPTKKPLRSVKSFIEDTPPLAAEVKRIQAPQPSPVSPDAMRDSNGADSWPDNGSQAASASTAKQLKRRP